MKRNKEILRELLVKLTNGKQAEELELDNKSFYISLLNQAGYLEKNTITFDGFEVADLIRNEFAWQYANAKSHVIGGPEFVSFELLVGLCREYIKNRMY